MCERQTLLYPLDLFYAEAGLPLPSFSRVAGEEVPEPYRRLLVHTNDMTPTLEAFHREKIHLRLVRRHIEGDAYCRQVILTTDESERPVEFGAIVIHTQHFPPAAREQILGGYTPLGTILAEHGVRHESCPQGFFQVMSDAEMNRALGLAAPGQEKSWVLYGRRNLLLAPEGWRLAEVLEILPPERGIGSGEV